MLSRKILLAAGALMALAIAPVQARAQDYPDRPVKLIVTFAAGGVGDTIGRAVAEKASAALGQAVVVENRAGGNSIIGSQYAARAEPDGYTVLQITGSNVIVTKLQPDLSYDYARDFVPIIGIGSFPTVLTTPLDSGIESIDDIVRVAGEPGGLTYASGGVGSLGHLGVAMLLNRLGVEDAVHLPFKGNSEALQATLGGQVQLFQPAIADALGMAQAGRLRVLAVTSPRRLPTLPDVPTMAELGYPEIDPRVWYGFLVPAGTPPEIVEKLHDAIEAAVLDPETQAVLQGLDYETAITDGPSFGAFAQSEIDRWGDIIALNGIALDN